MILPRVLDNILKNEPKSTTSHIIAIPPHQKCKILIGNSEISLDQLTKVCVYFLIKIYNENNRITDFQNDIKLQDTLQTIFRVPDTRMSAVSIKFNRVLKIWKNLIVCRYEKKRYIDELSPALLTQLSKVPGDVKVRCAVARKPQVGALFWVNLTRSHRFAAVV